MQCALLQPHGRSLLQSLGSSTRAPRQFYPPVNWRGFLWGISTFPRFPRSSTAGTTTSKRATGPPLARQSQRSEGVEIFLGNAPVERLIQPGRDVVGAAALRVEIKSVRPRIEGEKRPLALREPQAGVRRSNGLRVLARAETISLRSRSIRARLHERREARLSAEPLRR